MRRRCFYLRCRMIARTNTWLTQIIIGKVRTLHQRIAITANMRIYINSLRSTNIQQFVRLTRITVLRMMIDKVPTTGLSQADTNACYVPFIITGKTVL